MLRTTQFVIEVLRITLESNKSKGVELKIAMCNLCRSEILKGDRIAVLSYPLVSTSDEADYSVLGDFLDKEKVVHFDCFKQSYPELERSLNKTNWVEKAYRNEKVPIKAKRRKFDAKEAKSFHDLLKSIGENVSVSEVNDFVLSQEGITDNEQLLSLWLEIRN